MAEDARMEFPLCRRRRIGFQLVLCDDLDLVLARRRDAANFPERDGWLAEADCLGSASLSLEVVDQVLVCHAPIIGVVIRLSIGPLIKWYWIITAHIPIIFMVTI